MHQSSTPHQCPACSGDPKPVPGAAQVFTCKSCGGIFGTCYRGDVSRFVKLHEFVDGEAVQYFDFVMLCGDGQRRRTHGWMDAQRRVVQFG